MTDSPNAIPEETVKEPLLTMAASTVLMTLPTSATTVLKSYVPTTVLAAPENKITIKLKAIGSTPLLKQSVYKISGNQEFQVLVRFLRKQLKCKPQDSIFCYINSNFAPGLDDLLGNLYQNFAIDGNLQVSYCYTVAFG